MCASFSVKTHSSATVPVTCAIMWSRSEYEAILNGTPRNMSQLHMDHVEREFAVCHEELKEHVAWRQPHLVYLTRVPRSDNDTSVGRTFLYLFYRILNLVYDAAVDRAPLAPLYAVDAAKVAVELCLWFPIRGLGIVCPYRSLGAIELFESVVVAAPFEEPEQLALNRFERELLCSDCGEALTHLEAHLYRKQGAGGRVTAHPVDTFVHNFAEYVVVDFHGLFFLTSYFALLFLYVAVKVQAGEHIDRLPAFFELRHRAAALILTPLAIVARQYRPCFKKYNLRDAPPDYQWDVIVGRVVGYLHCPSVNVAHIAPAGALTHLDEAAPKRGARFHHGRDMVAPADKLLCVAKHGFSRSK